MTGRRALWPVWVGMGVAVPAAVVASATTLATLASRAGWPGLTPWLLPATVDVAGFVGGWAWIRPGAPGPARRFGRVIALVCAGGSLAGNGLGHLITTGYVQPGPALVVVVGAVPAAVLVALGHLAALALTPDTVTEPTPETWGVTAGEAPTSPAADTTSKPGPRDLERDPVSPSPVAPATAARVPRMPPPARRTATPPRASAVDREAAAWALADRSRDPERGGHPGHRVTAAEVKAELRKPGGPGVSNGDAGRLARLVNGDRGPAADTAAADEDEPAGERVA